MTLARAIRVLRRRLYYLEGRIRRNNPLRFEAAQLHDRLERAAIEAVLEELCAPVVGAAEMSP